MKKLLTAAVLATTIGTAQAGIRAYPHPHNNYYHHHSTTHDEYAGAMKAMIVVGVAVIAGVVLYNVGYEAGQKSRWGVSRDGVTYRF